jgi:hypothetical protein
VKICAAPLGKEAKLLFANKYVGLNSQHFIFVET